MPPRASRRAHPPLPLPSPPPPSFLPTPLKPSCGFFSHNGHAMPAGPGAIGAPKVPFWSPGLRLRRTQTVLGDQLSSSPRSFASLDCPHQGRLRGEFSSPRHGERSRIRCAQPKLAPVRGGGAFAVSSFLPSPETGDRLGSPQGETSLPGGGWGGVGRLHCAAPPSLSPAASLKPPLCSQPASPAP